MLRIASVLVLSLLSFAVLAQRPPLTESTHEQFASYWTAEAGWHTELQLRNNRASSDLVVTPYLRLISGEEIPLTAVTVHSNEVQTVDVNEGLRNVRPALLGATQAYGSVVLRYKSPSLKNLFASVMLHDMGHPIMFHLDAINEAPKWQTGSREGIWWLPNTNVRDYLVISNQSKEPVHPILDVTDDSGKVFSSALELGPGVVSRISVRDSVTAAGFTSKYGGIRIRSNSKAGSVDAIHILYDEVAGFAANMKMFDHDPAQAIYVKDPQHLGKWITRAPMLALSHPDKALALPQKVLLQPSIFVRNTLETPIRVEGDFHWRDDSTDGRYAMPVLDLAPLETRLIDVAAMQNSGKIPPQASWAEVSLETDAGPNAFLAVATSFNKTLRYGAQTPFSDQLATQLVGGQWQVDTLHDTLMTIGNASKSSTNALLTVYFEKGTRSYELEHLIEADDQWLVDFSRLIQDGVADRHGKLLPRDLSKGSYSLITLNSDKSSALYEGKVITDKRFGHAAYGCPDCCGYYTTFYEPYPGYVPVSGYVTLNPLGQNVCTDNNEWLGDGLIRGHRSTHPSSRSTIPERYMEFTPAPQVFKSTSPACPLEQRTTAGLTARLVTSV